ncbi:MAG: hypothetical protein NZ805_03025 [Armatimonadetes bacterium]|nr:hypothetical protein [Armatimonadota bacterium]MDW8027858.1 hypothetical protein [Armatimonadota bacterium]
MQKAKSTFVRRGCCRAEKTALKKNGQANSLALRIDKKAEQCYNRAERNARF